jgi:hypothetical protein
MKKLLFTLSLLALFSLVSFLGFSQQCIQPDNGTGTATLPPVGCDYLSPDESFMIIDGLPPGSTIQLDGPLTNMACCISPCELCTVPLPPGVCEGPGGFLGGNGHCFTATLDFQLTGTGDLAGFTRFISLPVFCEVHTAPRAPGEPVQVFLTDLFRLQGELFGDPDFDFLNITGGSDFGLPSPGQTTLTQLPNGDFAIDSFFDITYRIEFLGTPGSPLEGYTGATTGTIRLETGEEVVQEDPIFPGEDHFTSPCGSIGFGLNSDYPPLPAGFFGPGSDPFDGIIALEGTNSDGSQIPEWDVVINRMDIASFPQPFPSSQSVPIEIIELKLKSSEPIGVGFDGFPAESFFDVFFEINIPVASQCILTQMDDFGGEFEYLLTFHPIVTFVDLETGDSHVFNPAAQGEAPLTFTSEGANLWTRSPIEGEFDVVVGERVVLQSGAGTTIDLLPLPIRFENFFVGVDEEGLIEGFEGTGWNNSTWYVYPNFEWTNVWFYDHPVAPDRRKIITGSMLVEPRDPTQTSYVEVVWNYSTPAWPGWPEVAQPPLPEDFINNPALENQMIVRTQPLIQLEELGQAMSFEVPYDILDYNPEWLSIDIRGYNYLLSGQFQHICWDEGDCGENLDWGDAPDDPYPTLASSVGASHIIDPDVFMGDYIDSEADGQPTIDAMGDDNNPAVGPDDEDGVEFLWPISAGNPCKVKVKASVSDAFLNAWVDFNGDGDWDDLGDQIFTDEPLLVVGDNFLNFVAPKDAVPGATYARFRFSHQTGYSYRGQAYDGEVEDYIVEVDDYGNIKWRQLPGLNLPGLHANAPTLVADDWLCNGGAVTDIHWWGNYEDNIMGQGIDHFILNFHYETDCQPVDPEFMSFIVHLSDIQEVNTGLVNNEGSVIYYYEYYLPEPFYQEEGNTYFLSITAVPVAPDPDFQWRWQEAGRWFNPILCGAADNGLGYWKTITWQQPGPEDRYSDMAFIITSNYTPQDELDYGDAPDSPYPTLLGTNGARHIVDPAIFMGYRIDTEPNGIPTLTALGDDNTNLDDEDGVTFIDPFVVGNVATVKIRVSVDGYINAWLDYNRDGAWGAAEHAIPNLPVVAGLNTLSFNIPAGAKPGRTFARFRYNTTGGLSPTGQAQDGEVEDYRLILYPPNWEFTPTGSSHLISVPVNMLLNCVPLVQDDFVSVWFTDENNTLSCGGAAYWDGTNTQVLFAFGNDQTTPSVKEGFDENENFLWKVYYSGSATEQVVEVGYDNSMPNFDGKFHDNGLSALTWMTDPIDVTASAVPMTVCEGDPVQLDASITGGCGSINYTWTSVPAGFVSNIKNPIDNPTVITTYLVSADDGYTSDTDQITVTVIPVPDLVCPDDIAVCVDDDEFALSGATPTGGTYSGNGVNAGIFYPSVAGQGSHEITYTFVVAGTNCYAVCTFYINVNGLPNVDCPPFMEACYKDPLVELDLAGPNGGVYSGIGVTFNAGAYWFNPSIGVGTYLINYCWTDPDTGCTGCCEFNFYVHPLPIPDCPEVLQVCENDDPFDLTVSTPAGGTYSGPGVTANKFYPAVAGPGTHTIEYCWTDPQTGCTGCCEFDIKVIDVPEVLCPDPVTSCYDDPPFVLSGAIPSGGTYAGPGVIGGMFYPSTAGSGTHIIVYTYVVPGTNCSDFCTYEITVYPLPVMDCPPTQYACDGDADVLLTGGYPLGGEYSGTGVSFDGTDYWFDPDVGPGTYIILYCFTDPLTNCSDCCEFNFVVHPLPVLVCPDNDIVLCENDDPLTLAGLATPFGGVYRMEGNVITTFDPTAEGPGDHVIEYCWTDPQTGCTGCCEFLIVVFDIPTLTCPDNMEVCVDDDPFTLSGATPAGGVYSGPGVTAGVFNPSAAGAGTHTITYTYTINFGNFGCSDFCTFEIKVNLLPNVDCPPFMEACFNDPPVKLDLASPSGGIYTGPGVYFDAGSYWFNPSIGIGTFLINYCWTDPLTGCTGCCEFNFYVRPLPEPVCPDNMLVCEDDDPFDLTGATPTGGTYSGPGVTANKFYPAVAGPGTHTIEYCWTNLQTSCTGCCEFNVEVIDVPQVFCPDPITSCYDDPPFILSGAMPSGGTYAGPGVIGGMFYPSTAGAGTHTIVYNYVVPGANCSNFCTFEITVYPLPVMDCPPTQYACDGDADVKLTGGYPLGGEYSGTGVSFDGTDYWFDPDIGSGTYSILYCFTDPLTNCSNCCEFDFVVFPLPVVDCPPNMSVCLDTSPFDLTGATPAGGTYTGTGVSGNKFYPAIAGAGEHFIEYCWTNPQTLCVGCCIFKITVIDIPEIGCPDDKEVCLNEDPLLLNEGTPSGGTYSGNGVSLIGGDYYFNPMTAGLGPHIITYTIGVPGTNCFAQCEFKITVKPLPQMDCPGEMGACVDSGLVPLGNTYPLGGSYTGNGVVFNGGVYYFDTSIGVGNYLITYCYTDPVTGCTNCCEFVFVVIPLPVINCGEDITVCIVTEPFILTQATPSGGVYSGDGVSGNIFDPEAAGAGEHLITYVYTDPITLCTNTCTFKIKVIEVIATCPDNMVVCLNDPAFELTGATPVGGYYFGPGVTGDDFDPAVAGVGLHTITYCVADPLFPNCVGCCDFTITVNELPNLDCPGSFEVCLNTLPVELIAYPIGGEFNGNGVYFDGGKWYFEPMVGIGPHPIEYCYTDPDTGCTSCCEFVITVVVDQLIEVHPGWQGISSYIVPDDPDIVNLTHAIEDELVILFEYPDLFYYPAGNINTIINWDTYKGYILKSSGDTDLPMCGNEVYPKILSLDIGWQVIPVLSPYPVSVEAMFASVGGLVIVKDVAGGNVYWKDYNINTIGNLEPGVSYFVKMADQGVIEFPQEVDNSTSYKPYLTNPVISPWNEIVITPSSHTVAFNLASSIFEVGDIVGGFTNNGVCAGLVEVVDTNQAFALSLNGDDSYTSEIDGFEIEEYFSYKVYRPSTGETFEIEATYNPNMNQGFFEFNGMSEVTSVKMSAIGFGEQGLNNIRIFPNPSHGIFNIEGINESVDVTIYNAFGEQVITNEMNLPQKLDLSSQPNGVYFIRIFTKDGVHFEKLVIN